MGMLASVSGGVRRGAHNAFGRPPSPGVGAPRGMALETPAPGLRRLVMRVANELKANYPDADNAQILAAAQKKVFDMTGQR